MGRHMIWRKSAKKFRRKRIRSKLAQERDALEEIAKLSPSYIKWKKQQDSIEEALIEEENEAAKRREQQWIEAELKAQQEFKLKQIEKTKKKEEFEKQKAELLAQIEEREKKKKNEQKAKEAESLRLQKEAETRENVIQKFLTQGYELPAELRIPFETKPEQPICPFFAKVGACRYFSQCTRNHIEPTISDSILIMNMFTHVSLNLNSRDRKAGDQQDWGLEFGEDEVRNAYLEFFNDVTTELSSLGKLVRFLVSCNAELHLRGNVYAQFQNEREALKAFRALTGRWFGGKQLQPKFVSIADWRNAVCGLHYKNRCPKGKSCNFLHIFRNPGRKYIGERETSESTKSRSLSPLNGSPSRKTPVEWSWSTPDSVDSRCSTPDVIDENTNKDRDKNKSCKSDRDSHRGNSRKSKRHRKRSQSPCGSKHKKSRSSSPTHYNKKRKKRSERSHTHNRRSRSRSKEKSYRDY